MTVNTLGILARAAISASRHAGHDAQSLDLGFCWNTLVFVSTLIAVWTFFAQIVDVAHLEFANTINFGFVKVACRVYALAFAVPWDA